MVVGSSSSPASVGCCFGQPPAATTCAAEPVQGDVHASVKLRFAHCLVFGAGSHGRHMPCSNSPPPECTAHPVLLQDERLSMTAAQAEQARLRAEQEAAQVRHCTPAVPRLACRSRGTPAAGMHVYNGC